MGQIVATESLRPKPLLWSGIKKTQQEFHNE